MVALEENRPELLPRVAMVTAGVFEAFVKMLPYEPLTKPFDAVVLRGLVEQARKRRAA